MSNANPLFWWHKPAVIVRYGVAVLSVTAALIVARWPELHLETAPVSLFLCAVMFSAWLGGFKPGLLATALSVLAFYYYFLAPISSLGVKTEEMPRLVIFTLAALFVVSLTAAQRNAAESLWHARADLDRTVQELKRMNEALQAEIADRKRAEEALRDSEERFRRLVELMPVAVYVCDASGIIQSYNKRAAELWGREPKLGDTAQLYCGSLRMYSPDGKFMPHQESPMAEVLRIGIEARNLEVVMERPDGSRITVAANILPLRDGDGELIVAINCFQDITERKRAEKELQHLFGQSRALIDAIPQQIWSGPPDGTIDYCNDRWRSDTGLGLEDLQGDGWQTMLHPEDRDRVIKAWHKSVLNGTPYEQEERHRGVDGTYRWFLSRGVPLRDADGRIVRWYGTNTDIEDRKRAEEALRRSETYLTQSERISHVGSWAWDVSTREIVFCSQENHRIFGFDPDRDELTFEKALNRLHPEDRPVFDRTLERMMGEKRDFELDFRLVLPNGSIKYIHSTGHPILNERGHLVEYICTHIDVTERNRAEEALQRSRDQLRALAARVQTIREEERTRVAREIHDELGQALTAIKIDLSSLIHGLPPDKKQQSESILNLVDQTIRSVRTISTELRPGILDDLGLVAAVEWAAQEFEARTGTKCRVNLPKDDIVIDRERATAVFRTLQETLTNVARHANATQVNVRLAKDDGNLTLEVHDNGKGISEEELSAGRSLGILGMRERALLLGGELAISGASGKGTTVRVRLPEAHCK